MNEAFPFGDRNTVVTVGTFDGVHLGHRAVLEEIARRARGLGLASLLVTFEPHPLAIVNPENQPHLLTLPNERREVLAQCDVDYVAFLPFTRNLSQYTPRQFIKLLLDRFGMTELVIGYDHGLGRGRAGDVAVLTRLGQELDFAVDVVDAVTELRRPRPVSSTLIRRAVAGGDLETAAELLGRPYSMTGIGGTGAGRGKGLGFPTINVPPPPEEKLLPPDGVYAVTVEWSAGSAAGMLNQGP
ncbi:MAG: riboflavin kinase, partial [Gemmatimonadales bacterium]